MRVRDVSVRIERVVSMPHGAKMLIDEPAGEDLVVWVLASFSDDDLAVMIDQHLTRARCRASSPVDELRLCAS